MNAVERFAVLTKEEADLRGARSFYEWALRHGNAGDCARGRRYLADAKTAAHVAELARLIDARQAGAL